MDFHGEPPRRFQILALDVDGTLLDGDGVLRPRTVDALARAARAGIQPVLCTGRRYRRARSIAEELGLDAPIVCNSGALVKRPSDHATLWRAAFDDDTLGEVFRLFREARMHAVSFTDRVPEEADFLTSRYPTGDELFDEYVTLNLPHAEIHLAWLQGAVLAADHFHVCAVGDRAAMLRFEEVVLRALPDRVRTFVQKSPKYRGTMCEILPIEASKWSAVLHVAALWGVDPSAICAVGDDMNDVPMIQGAGFGVAMGHAPEAVLAVADHVTMDHDNDGVSVLIEQILLPQRRTAPLSDRVPHE
jgi:Cof subfamily protein (haloacid dehalogenase superfamily)